jgi:hypothetical protein
VRTLLPTTTIPESEVLALCLDWLNTIPLISCWRNNVVAVAKEATETSKRRFIRAGQKGQADITGVGPAGIRIEIEVKRKGKVPSDDQKDWLGRMQRHGGLAFYADSIEMCVEKMREEWKKRNWPWQTHWEPL